MLSENFVIVFYWIITFWYFTLWSNNWNYDSGVCHLRCSFASSTGRQSVSESSTRWRC